MVVKRIKGVLVLTRIIRISLVLSFYHNTSTQKPLTCGYVPKKGIPVLSVLSFAASLCTTTPGSRLIPYVLSITFFSREKVGKDNTDNTRGG